MDPGVSTWAQIGRGEYLLEVLLLVQHSKNYCVSGRTFHWNQRTFHVRLQVLEWLHSFFCWTHHELETSSPNSWQRFSRKTPRIPMSSDRLYQVTPNSWLVQLFNSPEIMEIIDFLWFFGMVFAKHSWFCRFSHWFLTQLPSCGWSPCGRRRRSAAPLLWMRRPRINEIWGFVDFQRNPGKWHGHVQQFYWDLHHQEKYGD